jgi:hypothetical protein
LARRGGLAGLNFKDEVKCDMIAESCRDLISKITDAPFKYDFCCSSITSSEPKRFPVPGILSTRSDRYAHQPILVIELSSTHEVNCWIPNEMHYKLNDRRAKKGENEDAWNEYTAMLKKKWAAFSERFEAILKINGGVYMVGEATTYPDILVAHALTWFVEEVRQCRQNT